jgi:4-alpha-glucanotransferase
LPGSPGIGDLGSQTIAFLDALRTAGQRWWQMLPIGPTGYGDSPYQSLSTFAGNPLLISPEALANTLRVAPEDVTLGELASGGPIDFASVISHRTAWLRRTTELLRDRMTGALGRRWDEFRDRHGAAWLDDYALFAALKEAHGGRPWTDWDPGVARRHPDELARARWTLTAEVEHHRLAQFLFFEQWAALRTAATQRGIGLVGDLPLYVAHDSADVWTHPDLFALDEGGTPRLVAGVPPDYFSATGQRWGNPLYDWAAAAADDYGWWRLRLGHLLGLFDVVRLDHFRGLAGYWEIPAAEPIAVRGRWVAGPGDAFLDRMEEEYGQLPVIAEDLGFITDDVIALRERHGLPGMRVAQFGFDDAPDASIHDPARYPHDVWGYTGTHDNDTTEGWFWEGNPKRDPSLLTPERARLWERVGGGPVSWGLVELVARSDAVTTVYPAQDVLGLGSEDRMNRPGTGSGNWRWRLEPGQLDERTLHRLADVTAAADRAT